MLTINTSANLTSIPMDPLNRYIFRRLKNTEVQVLAQTCHDLYDKCKIEAEKRTKEKKRFFSSLSHLLDQITACCLHSFAFNSEELTKNYLKWKDTSTKLQNLINSLINSNVFFSYLCSSAFDKNNQEIRECIFDGLTFLKEQVNFLNRENEIFSYNQKNVFYSQYTPTNPDFTGYATRLLQLYQNKIPKEPSLLLMNPMHSSLSTGNLAYFTNLANQRAMIGACLGRDDRSLFPRRGGIGIGHDEREQTLNQLFANMDVIVPDAREPILNRPLANRNVIVPDRNDRSLFHRTRGIVGGYDEREATLNRLLTRDLVLPHERELILIPPLARNDGREPTNRPREMDVLAMDVAVPDQRQERITIILYSPSPAVQEATSASLQKNSPSFLQQCETQVSLLTHLKLFHIQVINSYDENTRHCLLSLLQGTLHLQHLLEIDLNFAHEISDQHINDICLFMENFCGMQITPFVNLSIECFNIPPKQLNTLVRNLKSYRRTFNLAISVPGNKREFIENVINSDNDFLLLSRGEPSEDVVFKSEDGLFLRLRNKRRRRV